MKTKNKQPIRHCALWHNGCGVARTKVLFRVGGHYPKDKNAKEFAYWMDREVYNAISLDEDAIVEDYKKFGRVDEAQNTDIYSNL